MVFKKWLVHIFWLDISTTFIYLNLKKLDKETLEDRLIWATLILSIWFLKLLPRDNVFSIILIFIVFAFSALLIVIKFSGGHLKDKK